MVPVALCFGWWAIVKKASTKALRDLYFWIQDQSACHQDEPFVHVQFHTYSGFFVYTVQTKHDLVIPELIAHAVLKRFHRYNLIYGTIACGAVFVPILSYFELRRQRKSLKRLPQGDGFKASQSTDFLHV